MSARRNNTLHNRDCARILHANGWSLHSQNGTSHQKWVKKSESIVIHSVWVNPMMWKRLCKEHNINWHLK